MALKRLENNEIYFKDAKWHPLDVIDCTVILEDTGEEARFTANPADPEDYGRELFAMLSGPKAAEVEACTEEEKLAFFSAGVRFDRNVLLEQSDWTQLPDVPEATKAAWKAYREALRDVPAQAGFPYNVEWPTPPS